MIAMVMLMLLLLLVLLLLLLSLSRCLSIDIDATDVSHTPKPHKKAATLEAHVFFPAQLFTNA
jgi:hypothetical protein